MYKVILLLATVLLIISCDEEEKEKPKNTIPDEEILADSLIPFSINQIYPAYAFWQSGIKLTLDKKDGFDASKLHIYFNDSLMNQIEVNSNETQFIVLTKMLNYCESGKWEFRYDLGDTIISKFSENYEIVNSEVRIDSVSFSACGRWGG